ncbi:MAG: ribonuclease P protein component [Victivallaceae bacterium]|nr:ribonuclease P protein component [Victivallaceae bacterium]
MSEPKQSLGKAEKLRVKADFDFVRANGRKQVGRLMVLVAAASPDGRCKSGVICSRKFSTLSVRRNRARRLLWESVRLNRKEILPCRLILIPRFAIAGRKCGEVQEEFLKLLARAGYRSDRPESDGQC